MLSNYEEVFDGKLGCYPHEKVHLELVAGAQPFCKKAYSVAHANEKLFKDELDNIPDIYNEKERQPILLGQRFQRTQ